MLPTLGKVTKPPENSTESEIQETKYWTLFKTLSPESSRVDANIY